jgi:alkylation response protein AidB-like acyl-CoA dehydrogenase
VLPHQRDRKDAGRVSRGLFAAAGKSGFLGIDVPDEYGGGVADFRFNAIVSEEVMRTGASAAGLGLTLHNDICIPYFLEYCSLGAEAALAAPHRLRPADHDDSNERTGRRVGPGLNHDVRPP